MQPTRADGRDDDVGHNCETQRCYLRRPAGRTLTLLVVNKFVFLRAGNLENADFVSDSDDHGEICTNRRRKRHAIILFCDAASPAPYD